MAAENDDNGSWFLYDGDGVLLVLATGSDLVTRHRSGLLNGRREVCSTKAACCSGSLQNRRGWYKIHPSNRRLEEGRLQYKSLIRIQVNDLVTSIPNRAFVNCASLKEIKIPTSVVSIGSAAFSRCFSLKKINIRNTSVTSIGDQAFSDCTFLTEIELPTSVASIGDNAFDSCSSLRSMRLPDSITSIGEHAFSHCWSLVTVCMPKNPNLTIGPGIFRYCPVLRTIGLPRMALTVWPRCLEQLNGNCPFGLTEVGKRTCMLSFLRQNVRQLFEDGSHPAVIVHGQGKKRQHEQE